MLRNRLRASAGEPKTDESRTAMGAALHALPPIALPAGFTAGVEPPLQQGAPKATAVWGSLAAGLCAGAAAVMWLMWPVAPMVDLGVAQRRTSTMDITVAPGGGRGKRRSESRWHSHVVDATFKGCGSVHVVTRTGVSVYIVKTQ